MEEVEEPLSLQNKVNIATEETLYVKPALDFRRSLMSRRSLMKSPFP